MFRPLLLAAVLASGAAMAQTSHDPRGAPGGVGGNQPAHVDGTDGSGVPVIHRPEIAPGAGVTSGAGTMRGGADDKSVTYSGPAQGTLGGQRPAIVVGNEDGRPVIVR